MSSETAKLNIAINCNKILISIMFFVFGFVCIKSLSRIIYLYIIPHLRDFYR